MFMKCFKLTLLFCCAIGIAVLNIGCNQRTDSMTDDILTGMDPSSEQTEWVFAELPVTDISVRFSDNLEDGELVQVHVDVTGHLPDDCTEEHETEIMREGNTFTYNITTKRPKDTVCATVIVPFEKQIFVGALEAGDYKVIVNGIEEQFTVGLNGDSPVVIADLLVTDVSVVLSEDKPVNVHIDVTGSLPDSCTEYHETGFVREGNTFTYNITTKRPKDAVCATVIVPFEKQIIVGALEAGDYKVIVNGIEKPFSVE